MDINNLIDVTNKSVNSKALENFIISAIHKNFDKESSTLTVINHDVKIIITSEYVTIFDLSTGTEVCIGKNDIDPFALMYPNLMDIGIMGHCDNHCSFCYQGNIIEEHMTFENYKKIMDQSKWLANQVALGGRGDPNLHPNFHDILSYTRSCGIVPNYTTSGIGLSKEQVKSSKEFCGAVAVSMYNKDYTFQALTDFMDAKCKTNIHFVLTSENVSTAIDILNGKDVWDNKVDMKRLNGIIFLLFKPQGMGKNKLYLTVSETDLKSFIFACRNNKPKVKIGIDACLGNKIHRFFGKELSQSENQYISTCESGRSSVYISPDMYLIPCSFGNKTTWGESILTSSISDIWLNSDKFKKVRKILGEDCARCPFSFE